MSPFVLQRAARTRRHPLASLAVAGLSLAGLWPAGTPSALGDDTPPQVRQPLAKGDEADRAFVSRAAAERGERVRRYGGTAASEAAVAAGLRWIVTHQQPDGSWSFDHRECPACRGKCSDPGQMSGQQGRHAATAMALLPLLGAGQTHLSGESKAAVKKGLDFLLSRIKPDGSLHEPGGSMYSHGLAAIALCEAYGMTNDTALRRPAQAAIDFIAAAQDPEGGGWRYMPRMPGDTSVTGWQLSALLTAAAADLEAPPDAMTLASHFLDQVQTADGAFYGYTTPSRGLATSAIGLLSRVQLGWDGARPALQTGVAALAKQGPSETNLYFDYYATQLLFHHQGETWRRWNDKLRDHLVASQSSEGHEQGSWSLRGDHGAARGGRLYCTSMATLILQTYYRVGTPRIAPQADPEPAPKPEPQPAPRGELDVWIGTSQARASKGIYHTRLNTGAGRLSTPELAAEISGPGFLALHPRGGHLYAVGAVDGRPSVAAYAITRRAAPAKPILEFVNAVEIGDGGAAHLAVDETGAAVLTAQYGGGSVALFSLNEDGSLRRREQLIKHEGGAGVVAGRQDASHAHWVGFSPDQRFAFVPDLGLDKVVIYKFNSAEGRLEPHGFAATPPGSGPRHMKFHTSGKWIYVLNELALSVSVFDYDSDAGAANIKQTIATVPPGELEKEKFNSASEIRVHPSGQFVYAANRGHDTITVFRVHPDSGELTVVEREPIRGATPRNFNLDPTGRWLIAAGQDSHTLTVFEIDRQTGELSYNRSAESAPAPICVLFDRP